MSLEDVDIVVSYDEDTFKRICKLCYDSQGWMTCIEDYAAYTASGKNNVRSVTAIEKSSGEIVANIIVVIFNEGPEPIVGVTLFLVLERYRGIGLGAAVYAKGIDIEEAKEGNLFLTGVPDMTEKYASRSGYDKRPEAVFETVDAHTVDLVPSNLTADPAVTVWGIEEVEFPVVAEYVSKVLGGARYDSFLKTYMTTPNVTARVAFDVDGRLVGVGGLRVSNDNKLEIAPLYADSDSVASTLLRALFESIPDRSKHPITFLHPVTTNKQSRAIFSKLAGGKDVHKPDLSVYPQFTKHVIPADYSKVYSLLQYCILFA